MCLTLKCPIPSCSYPIAIYDSDTNEYRIWIPNKRKLDDHHLFGPVRVVCRRCGLRAGWHVVPAKLTEPYLCPEDGSRLARPLDTGDYRDGILVHLPSVENELFCANAHLQCQSGKCNQWVNLDELRNTGKGMSFEADYSHLRKPRGEI